MVNISEYFGIPSFSFSESSPINEIKRYLLKIYELGERIDGSIPAIDKELCKSLSRLSYDLFCNLKHSQKTFTVCKNQKIKDMRIQEDADGLSENDTLYIEKFFSDNLLEVFSELVSATLLPKKAQPSKLFVAQFYSRYCNKYFPVYFAKEKEKVYIFYEKLTDVELSDYISNYFSASSEFDESMRRICNIVISAKTFIDGQKQIYEEVARLNDKLENSHSFLQGAITFLDFLAWKGMWQLNQDNNPLQEVSDLIDKFRDKLSELSRTIYYVREDVQLSYLISISDTIAIFSPKTNETSETDLLNMHARFAKYVVEECCMKQYPIRGAIAYGEYSIMKNIMIGPGIDECASWHEMGDWIGVHLTPTAQLYWEQSKGENGDIIKYKVPLKVKAAIDYCVKWSIDENAFMRLATKSRALLPEIAMKYANTKKFLEESKNLEIKGEE